MKRYQVFVSSTLRDLKEERRAVAQNILELNHIPVGMEYFGASDQQQLDFIKREIDNSDYYILIIAGKYGSIDPQTRKSYTQLEYEYAVSRGIPVLVFLRSGRQSLAVELRETDGSAIQLLDNFIAAASGDNRIRAEWNDISDLVNKTGNALNKEIIRTSDRAIGWVRADQSGGEAARREIDRLQDRIRSLEGASLHALTSSAHDAQTLYALTDSVIEKLKDADLTEQDRVELRAAAARNFDQLIQLALAGEVPPNLCFNAHVNAAKLDLDLAALKLVTLAQYLQASPSHKLAMLHKRVETASQFDVKDMDDKLQLVRVRSKPQVIIDETIATALTLVADAPTPQCEIVYSQVWNISQQLREMNMVESLLRVLAQSKAARNSETLGEWVSGLAMPDNVLTDFDWETQKGKRVPSYLVEKMAECIAFLSNDGWEAEFEQFATEALQIHVGESPMATWSKHVRQDLYVTCGRVGKLSFLSDAVGNHFNQSLAEFLGQVLS